MLWTPVDHSQGTSQDVFRLMATYLKAKVRSRTGALQEPQSSPTGALEEPCRSPTAALQELSQELYRSSTRALQEPYSLLQEFYRSPTGVLPELLTFAFFNSKVVPAYRALTSNSSRFNENP